MPRPSSDEGLKPYEVRVGVSVPRLGGMNRHDDPAALQANEHHLLVNTRLDGGEIVDRPGSAEEFDTQSSGCISGIIEVDEDGLGFWLVPCPKTYPTSDGYTMGNFNEEAATQLARFNNSDDDEPPWAKGRVYLDVWYKAPYSDNNTPWNSVINFRRKWLQVGTAFRAQEADPSTTDEWSCLYCLDFPVKNDPGPVGYSVYLFLENLNTTAGFRVSSMITTFERSDDEVSGDVRIGELLYIGTNQGTVLVWDGTTLQESHDFGGSNDYEIRLGAWPGGIFAVGSNGTSAVAAVLADGATSWVSVTLPAANFFCVAMHSFNGKLYVFDEDTAATATRGGRIYVYNGEGALPAHSFEFPFTDSSHYTLSAGLPFVYRKDLYVVAYRKYGAQAYWDLYRRDSDSTWTKGLELNGKQDYPASIDWVIVANQRIIMSGFYAETLFGSPIGGYLIIDVVPAVGYYPLYTSFPTEGITTGFEAFIVMPSEELDSEEV